MVESVVSSLLDIVVDEIERHEERIEYLRQVKEKLEKLIFDEGNGDDAGQV